MTNYFKKNSNLNFGQNNEKNVDGDFGKEKNSKPPNDHKCKRVNLIHFFFIVVEGGDR